MSNYHQNLGKAGTDLMAPSVHPGEMSTLERIASFAKSQVLALPGATGAYLYLAEKACEYNPLMPSQCNDDVGTIIGPMLIWLTLTSLQMIYHDVCYRGK